MKQKAIIVGCYAFLILIGGIMGYIIANSLASLIGSSIIALLLSICTAFIWRRNLIAYHLATFITACLLGFFTYRFLLTYKLAPGGIMAIISGILFTYLFIQRKKLALQTIKIPRN